MNDLNTSQKIIVMLAVIGAQTVIAVLGLGLGFVLADFVFGYLLG